MTGGNLRARGCYWGHAGVANATGKDRFQDKTRHDVWCPDGQYMRGWSCFATDKLDGECQALCCYP